ncbi:MAG: tetratricopeptide repeat protein, partial [Candidatus Aenigmarchaeota archaeon]|nr:tetratricopeptide repeat protein [Candidatus Aenigmarchaeota archaeon]
PLNNMAILLQKLGRLSESKESFEKALLIEENNSAILLNYANILAELGQNSMAEENYRKAIEINPDDKGAYRNFAQFLYNNERFIEAKEMLEKSY